MIRNIKTILILLVVALSATACFKPRDYDYSKWYADPTGGNAGRTIKVMSFNIYSAHLGEGETSWEYRRPAVKAMLAAQSPLVMGTQECDFIQRKNILEDDPRYAAIGIDLNGPTEECEECTVFYMKDSIEVVSHATFYLSSTPDTPSFLPGTTHYRVCTWGKMRLKKDGKEFYFFDSHIEYRAEQLRQPQMDVILAQIKEINSEGLPMLLLGDYNTDEDDSIFNGIKGYGFKSCRLDAAVGDSHKTHNNFTSSGQRRIDHIFYKGFSGVQRFTTDRTHYEGVVCISDHYPVWTIVKF